MLGLSTSEVPFLAQLLDVGNSAKTTALALTKVLFLSKKPTYFTVTVFSFKFLLQFFVSLADHKNTQRGKLGALICF